MFIQLDILTNHIINHALYLTNLLVGNFLEMREIETQGIGGYE